MMVVDFDALALERYRALFLLRISVLRSRSLPYGPK